MLAPTRTPPVFPPPLPEPQPGRISAEEMAARGNLLKPMGAPLASMETHFPPAATGAEGGSEAGPAAAAEASGRAAPPASTGTAGAEPSMAKPPQPQPHAPAPPRGQRLDLIA